MSDDFVSSDGSPLRMYLAIPADGAPLLIHEHVAPGASLLELGSGPGRLTRVLVALGHRVCAVDDSAEMLAHVTGAETVVGDVYALRLDRTFDAVVGASHLVNTPGADSRSRLFAVGRHHLGLGGQLLLERYRPGWIHAATPSVGTAGPVQVEFRPRRVEGRLMSASITYELAEQRWTQDFEAEDVSDEMLAGEAAGHGLRFDGYLGDDPSWVRLTAV